MDFCPQLRIPDEVYVDSLKPCHAQIIYDHWAYSSETTLEIITKAVFLKFNFFLNRFRFKFRFKF